MIYYVVFGLISTHYFGSCIEKVEIKLYTLPGTSSNIGIKNGIAQIFVPLQYQTIAQTNMNFVTILKYFWRYKYACTVE
jgi:hypothetical protein